ncbi:hypothetical protein PENTCL1PPCAC_24016, partial [Pristionchus entomophagus]
MDGVVKTSRSLKREFVVTDDGESTSEQPILKSAKREAQAVPSTEVVELQQKVVMLESNFQRVCRAARTAELRAEAAESSHCFKYGINDGFQAEKKRADELELRLADVLAQLEEARRKAESAVNELTWENRALKTELAETKRAQQERIDELTHKLAQYEGDSDLLEMQLQEIHLPG